jgi:hypothetical protein
MGAATERKEKNMPSEEEILEKRTPRGGWTRKQLAEWGVPWPPPKGWKAELLKETAEKKT